GFWDPRQSIRRGMHSSYMSMRALTHEGIELHRFAGILPEQLLPEAARHHDAVVAADQRTVMRCLRDDLACFVPDISHVAPPVALVRPIARALQDRRTDFARRVTSG